MLEPTVRAPGAEGASGVDRASAAAVAPSGAVDGGPMVHPRRPGSGTRLDSLGAAAGSIIRIALVAIGVGFLLALFKPLVVALVGALFIAVALRPVVDVLIRRGMRPGAAAAIGMLIVV